jgi:hypothetical protein
MTRRAVLTPLMLVLLTTVLSAYVLNGPMWAGSPAQVLYYVDPTNLDMSASDALFTIERAAQTWSQSGAAFAYLYGGPASNPTVANDGKNNVYFVSTANGSVIGTTYWWYDGSNHLIGFDILFYDGGFTFLPSSATCSGAVYLEDVATHEFGHALGLGHSASTAATMYAVYPWCSTAMRSLDTDDIDGVTFLYPPTTEPLPPPPPGALTLTVRTYKTKGYQFVDLAWSGTSVTSVDLYRNGTRFITTANDGAFTDALAVRGGGSYRYKVCESGGTTVCSSEVTATF